ncbi:MAG: hypothetical protein CL904_01665 [Dehalococcoidia bacterium]|nr:hypothetical protein [Dehalococcoidia bacterium]
MHHLCRINMLFIKQVQDLFSQNYSLIRLFNSIHIILFRVTNGMLLGSLAGLPSLLLTTKGRRTGKLRTSALIYLEWEKKYLIVASFGGNPKPPAWLLNIKEDEKVTVHIPGMILNATAKVADRKIRDEVWPKLLNFYPSFGKYEELSGRTIPVVILEPLNQKPRI